jgi:hypothetical protein
MAIDGVMDDVDLGAGEPFVKRRLGLVEHFLPRLVPFQLGGFIGPKAFEVTSGAASDDVPVLEVSLSDKRGRGVIGFTVQLSRVNGALDGLLARRGLLFLLCGHEGS